MYEATGGSTSVTTTPRREGSLASPGTHRTHISIPVLHRLVVVMIVVVVVVIVEIVVVTHHCYDDCPGVPRNEKLFKLLS